MDNSLPSFTPIYGMYIAGGIAVQLIYYPNPILLIPLIPCELEIDDYSKKNIKKRMSLAIDMFYTMDQNKGAGLAAPQVGLKIRMFTWKHNGFNQAIWNPSLSYISGNIESIEGCLSLPNVIVTLQRATSSILSGIGLNGKRLRFIGNTITTRIWQHEIDHLDGKLIIDNMSREDVTSNRDALRTLLKNTVG